MLVLLFVALWFILRGELFYVLHRVILFLYFSVLLALRLPRLGKRDLILELFVRLFDLCLFGFVGFLFHFTTVLFTSVQRRHFCCSYYPFACSIVDEALFCVAVVPVLVLLFVALRFILEAIILCIILCYFVLVFFSPFSIAIISLGEKRANLNAFRTFAWFVLVCFCWFPPPLGVWEGLRFVIVALPGLFSYLSFSMYIIKPPANCLRMTVLNYNGLSWSSTYFILP